MASVRKVTDAAMQVIEAAGAQIMWDEQLAGKAAVKNSNTPIPEQLMRSIRRNKVALKGPIETEVGIGFRSVNVALRKAFDLYANVRPIRSLPGIKTAFDGVDLVVVRENTEDLYSGIEHQIAPGVVESVKVITARASRRIARYAFELAMREKRKGVAAIHKANIMKLSDGLFLHCCRQVAKGYPRITYREVIVDNACLQLVRDPKQFDVLLLENLYGDIVSDLCAGLVGGTRAGAGCERRSPCRHLRGGPRHRAGHRRKDRANPVGGHLLERHAAAVREAGRGRQASRARRASAAGQDPHSHGRPGRPRLDQRDHSAADRAARLAHAPRRPHA
jgi:isocitrate dehydrogenase (NAD+)